MNAATAETAATTASRESGSTPEIAPQRLLQRLILPYEASPDIVPLYIEAEDARSGATGGAFGLGGASDRDIADPGGSPRGASPAQVDVSELSDRHAARIPAHSMRSFGTYFNAFPASYWRRWTPVRRIRLTIRTAGSGHLIVMRSTARGTLQRQESRNVSGGPADQVFDLPLTAFGDGGWYWFDAYAGQEPLTILGAEWTADADLARTDGTFSISMTTMNKVPYCLDNIRTIAEDPDLRELLDVMYVIDQGSDRLRDHAGELDPLQETLGEQLQIIEQGNIGGSGGFSRGMYEASTGGASTYVINCDDDIVLEAESLIRMTTFADFATRPTIVGAHMFDLNNRSVLHTFGEVVDPWRIQPALANPGAEMGHDFALDPLRSTPWLHRRADVDYNGWWSCLIPTETVRAIGLSLPVFIKWDDAEYGLRAKKAGYPTVSLPGAGVWHMSWVDKDDLVGWQAYFHERNRIITALLHSPYSRGGRVIKESQFMDVKHLISMQYYTEAGRLMAQRDVLEGPDALHPSIGTKLPEIRGMAAGFDDAVSRKDQDLYPPVQIDKPPRKGRPFSEPGRLKLPVWTVKALAKQLVKPTKAQAEENPQAAIAHIDAKWWRLSAYDSALVSNAEGTQVSWYKRDPRQVREMLTGAIGAHLDLHRRWPELQSTYRRAAAHLTSFEAWERTFAENPAPVRAQDAEQSGSSGAGATTTGGSPA
ncbi:MULTISPECIES: glycosyltransferase [Brachybacterium]|uniref:glycosyltransferase n=1 Tax=Brachybacterium TaxID=43668 RepID=UPI000BB6F3E5|nr:MULTISPECIES: glycosyltransferase [Brachybacterium]PCC35674.1 glycosyl transferase [Brachybacterium alimentarium]RCS58930.1 glycosyltransferase family 2 protein [Brachybacterium sp. JB7]RCS66543.1 glycosyltransferase family 2 protein [Brachybacterium alimentarium]RCS67944.1 glycosyltransferase family 2 protein [Brachybacterium alimentarium]RCS80951.1 glycosyltransferase family 2 protein [Brachybacterium alimentarium]